MTAEAMVIHPGNKEDILTYKSEKSTGKHLHGTVDKPLILCSLGCRANGKTVLMRSWVHERQADVISPPTAVAMRTAALEGTPRHDIQYGYKAGN